MKQQPELLAPAGNFEKLKVAFHYGADAVYAGLDKLSLRANADNFTREELETAVFYTHALGKKIYLALNIYFTPEQTDQIIDALQFISRVRPDGIILSDMGTLELVQQYAPEIPIHISTQANCTNQYAAKMYQKLGVDRVVLARELSLSQISEIKKAVPDVELEAFVHGAMCIAYSGRCILSSYMTTEGLGARRNDQIPVRSANKGDCAHSCRWEFTLKEKSRPNEPFEITEDSNGTYVLSSRDICMINHLKDLIDAGVDSFKIEGRMKSILYISSIVRAYRYMLDHLDENQDQAITAQINNELDVVSHREFSTGFFYHSPKEKANQTASIKYERNVRLAAMVLKPGNLSSIKLYNKLSTSDSVELIGRNMKTIKIGTLELFNSNGEQVDTVRHTEEVQIRLYDENGQPLQLEEFDILRIESHF